MSYIIAQKNALVLTAHNEIEALKLAENLTSTTGQECGIFEKRFEVVMSNNAAYIVDITNMATPSNIIRKVSEINMVNDNDLKVNRRSRVEKYRETRQWIAFIHVKIGKKSLIKAGEIICRNHSTVSNAIKRIVENYNYDSNFRKKYEEVINLCIASNPKCFDL